MSSDALFEKRRYSRLQHYLGVIRQRFCSNSLFTFLSLIFLCSTCILILFLIPPTNELVRRSLSALPPSSSSSLSSSSSSSPDNFHHYTDSSNKVLSSQHKINDDQVGEVFSSNLEQCDGSTEGCRNSRRGQNPIIVSSSASGSTVAAKKLRKGLKLFEWSPDSDAEIKHHKIKTILLLFYDFASAGKDPSSSSSSSSQSSLDISQYNNTPKANNDSPSNLGIAYSAESPDVDSLDPSVASSFSVSSNKSNNGVSRSDGAKAAAHAEELREALRETASRNSNHEILHVGVTSDNLSDFQFFLGDESEKELPFALIVEMKNGWKKYRLSSVVETSTSGEEEGDAIDGESAEWFSNSDSASSEEKALLDWEIAATAASEMNLLHDEIITIADDKEKAWDEAVVTTGDEEKASGDEIAATADKDRTLGEEIAITATREKVSYEEVASSTAAEGNREEARAAGETSAMSGKEKGDHHRQRDRGLQHRRHHRHNRSDPSSLSGRQNRRQRSRRVLSSHQLMEFEKAYFEGSLQPWLRSEAPVDGGELSVLSGTGRGRRGGAMLERGVPQQIVGSQFRENVLNTRVDTLLFLFAPWCGHCKFFQGKFEELTKKFEKIKSIDFLKMDATRNDIDHVGITIERVPYVRLFKSGQKNSHPISFDHTTKDLVQYGTDFLINHSTCDFDIENGTEQCQLGDEDMVEL